MDDLENLATQWFTAKHLEQAAMNERRDIEDKMMALMRINIEDGVVNRDANGIKIKVTMRQNVTVDGNALTLIYKDNRIPQNEIDKLFRWKPQLNLREWKAASDEIKAIVAGAITTQPGRPTFTINMEDN